MAIRRSEYAIYSSIRDSELLGYLETLVVQPYPESSGGPLSVEFKDDL